MYELTVMTCEVSTLTHELWNYSVEGTLTVTEPMLTRAEGPEILSRLRYNIGPQLKHYPSLNSKNKNLNRHWQ